MASASQRRPGPEVSNFGFAPGARPRSCAIRSSPFHRLERAQQHAGPLALRLAGKIHAEMHAVDEVDVGEPGRPEQHRVARRLAGKGVRGGIVEAEVGLHLDNAAGEAFGLPARAGARLVTPHQQFAEQAARDHVGRVEVEIPGRIRAFAIYFDGNPFRTARTSSAWPSGLTFGKTFSRRWSGPMRNVVRSIPITFFPYIFFSFRTPN